MSEAREISMTTAYFEDLVEGQEYVSRAVTVDKDEMLECARKNDPWPLHVDEEACAGLALRWPDR